MTRNEEYIQNAFTIFYTVLETIDKWTGYTELKNSIAELNKKHLLDNLDKALVQVNEETEGDK